MILYSHIFGAKGREEFHYPWWQFHCMLAWASTTCIPGCAREWGSMQDQAQSSQPREIPTSPYHTQSNTEARPVEVWETRTFFTCQWQRIQGHWLVRFQKFTRSKGDYLKITTIWLPIKNLCRNRMTWYLVCAPPAQLPGGTDQWQQSRLETYGNIIKQTWELIRHTTHSHFGLHREEDTKPPQSDCLACVVKGPAGREIPIVPRASAPQSSRCQRWYTWTSTQLPSCWICSSGPGPALCLHVLCLTSTVPCLCSSVRLWDPKAQLCASSSSPAGFVNISSDHLQWLFTLVLTLPLPPV